MSKEKIKNYLSQFTVNKQTYKIECQSPDQQLKRLIEKIDKHKFSDKSFTLTSIYESLKILIENGNEDDIDSFNHDESLLDFLDCNENLIHSTKIKKYDTFAMFLDDQIVDAKEQIFTMTKIFVES